jgi:hypothetical protein
MSVFNGIFGGLFGSATNTASPHTSGYVSNYTNGSQINWNKPGQVINVSGTSPYATAYGGTSGWSPTPEEHDKLVLAEGAVIEIDGTKIDQRAFLKSLRILQKQKSWGKGSPTIEDIEEEDKEPKYIEYYGKIRIPRECVVRTIKREVK